MGAEHGAQRVPRIGELRRFMTHHKVAQLNYTYYNLRKPPAWKHAQIVINHYGCKAPTITEGWSKLVKKTTEQATERMAESQNGGDEGIYSHGTSATNHSYRKRKTRQ